MIKHFFSKIFLSFFILFFSSLSSYSSSTFDSEEFEQNERSFQGFSVPVRNLNGQGGYEIEMHSIGDDGDREISRGSRTHNTFSISEKRSLESLKKDEPTHSSFLKCLECYTNCCAGYHVGCQSFWSTLNGPLGFGSLASSAASTILSVIAAAAVSSSDPSLIYNLSIASTVLGTASAILGAFKMYAQSRSTTEQEKAIRDLEAKYRAHIQSIREAKSAKEAELEEDPTNEVLKKEWEKYVKLLENAEKDFETLKQSADVMRGQQSNVVESESKQQAYMLNANQMNALNDGGTTTEQPDFENLPAACKGCQYCLGAYDMGTFTCYHVLEGPAGLGNMFFSSAGAALMAFSIFNTGNVQEALIYTAAASDAVATIFSAFKFYAGARVSSSLSRIKNLWKGDASFNSEQHRLDLLAKASENALKRQSQLDLVHMES